MFIVGVSGGGREAARGQGFQGHRLPRCQVQTDTLVLQLSVQCSTSFYITFFIFLWVSLPSITSYILQTNTMNEPVMFQFNFFYDTNN